MNNKASKHSGTKIQPPWTSLLFVFAGGYMLFLQAPYVTPPYFWPIMKLKYLVRTSSLSTVLLVSSVTYATEPWTVAGAGNSTCRDWRAAELNQKNEILSWMIGFASAVNVYSASHGRPRVRLDRLSTDYLRGEITSTCAMDGNAKVPMVDIIFRVLKDLPFK